MLRDTFHLFHVIHMATVYVNLLMVSLGSWRTIVAIRDSTSGFGLKVASMLVCSAVESPGGGPGEWAHLSIR